MQISQKMASLSGSFSSSPFRISDYRFERARCAFRAPSIQEPIQGVRTVVAPRLETGERRKKGRHRQNVSRDPAKQLRLNRTGTRIRRSGWRRYSGIDARGSSVLSKGISKTESEPDAEWNWRNGPRSYAISRGALTGPTLHLVARHGFPRELVRGVDLAGGLVSSHRGRCGTWELRNCY